MLTQSFYAISRLNSQIMLRKTTPKEKCGFSWPSLVGSNKNTPSPPKKTVCKVSIEPIKNKKL